VNFHKWKAIPGSRNSNSDVPHVGEGRNVVQRRHSVLKIALAIRCCIVFLGTIVRVWFTIVSGCN
jgi:hypothetical protein